MGAKTQESEFQNQNLGNEFNKYTNKNHPSLFLTEQEKAVILYSIRHNEGFLSQYSETGAQEIKNENNNSYYTNDNQTCVIDVIKSLVNKGFAKKNPITELYRLTDNVMLLVKLEGDSAFDEIVVGETQNE